MPDQPTAAELQAAALHWLDCAAAALELLTAADCTSIDALAAAAIGTGYNSLAHYELLVENRAADLARFAEHRRDDLERVTAADQAQRQSEASVADAAAAMKRLADVQIAAWAEQYPHLVEALEAGVEEAPRG